MTTRIKNQGKEIKMDIYENLFVFDLANNHQGSVEHAKKIVDSIATTVTGHDIKPTIKFQFRDLTTFISKTELENPRNKHVPRFLQTRLSWDDFNEIVKYAREKNLFTACTPFDENSVEKIIEFGFDYIKLASCSARDWPLIEAVCAANLPIIASTGGLSLSEIDDLVSFFTHRGSTFALMHCVSIYPTPDDNCNLNNIGLLRARFPDVNIGWSTHEPPADTMHIGLALAQGATMFERHVGLQTEDIALNAYSSDPEQLSKWIDAYVRAKVMLGVAGRENNTVIERESIDALTRGVFAKNPVSAGESLTRSDVYFAFPLEPDQLSTGQWKDGIVTKTTLQPNTAITHAAVEVPRSGERKILKKAIHEVKALLNYAKVPLSHEFTTEYSHHYGIENFAETGAVLITVVNRAYAKKILVQLPGQTHPSHFHKRKEETFIVIWGELISVLDGREKILTPGDTLTVPPGVWHSFSTVTGCVFEEISTTAYKNDSEYQDAKINEMTSADRKTSVDHWGRFQIADEVV